MRMLRYCVVAALKRMMPVERDDSLFLHLFRPLLHRCPVVWEGQHVLHRVIDMLYGIKRFAIVAAGTRSGGGTPIGPWR